MTTIAQIAKTLKISQKAARQRARRAGMTKPKGGWQFKSTKRVLELLRA